MIHGSGEVLAKLLFRKDEEHETIVEYAASASEVGILVWSLLASKDYNDAESLLLGELDRNFDFEVYDTGWEFFYALEKMSDEELFNHGYSREQIWEGERRLVAILMDKCGLRE